ncbi:TPA: hypothetical protein DD449_00380 [Candidatus Berkelbacteria bacterium]|uniref:Uncharacterized protein n=1 Tax=Berkelbacteria bacterium GW2011_GWE1_39_12 TaxID=1618337 RepID=A0A0G4B4C2_9BACT|nr:MAG: hypothetical protein UT28_C0001G1012 [Berkelbacteria bacterium GW2011_GWE1_39_12]HBO60130.1 hypothetical protein [Candidatus Berkelbacteria bacterium]
MARRSIVIGSAAGHLVSAAYGYLAKEVGDLDFLHFWSLERIEVQADDSREKKSDHKMEGVILFRRSDSRVCRLRVEIVYKSANEVNYRFKCAVTDLSKS